MTFPPHQMLAVITTMTAARALFVIMGCTMWRRESR